MRSKGAEARVSLTTSVSRRAILGGAGATAVAAPVLAEECRIGPRPHQKGPLVWMDMDQVELDAAYDQSFYAPGLRNVLARFASDSDLARERLGEPRREAYGPTDIDPAVTAAMFGVDVAALQIKINEGVLYPSLAVSAGVQDQWEANFGTGSPAVQQLNASALAQLKVPIYQGGAEYSVIRQSKEALGQKRFDLDTARDQAEANVVEAWAQVEGTKMAIEATRSQVTAAEFALNGVREEAHVGQRTTLDVLNAEQELVNDRVAPVSAQRDRIVASYTLLSSGDGLSASRLGLKVQIYDPVVHYFQVRDSWAGVRTPDGR
jgi:hypothetical protein